MSFNIFRKAHYQHDWSEKAHLNYNLELFTNPSRLNSDGENEKEPQEQQGSRIKNMIPL